MNKSLYGIAAVVYIAIGIAGLILGALDYWELQPEGSIFSVAFLVAGVLIFFANRRPSVEP